IAWVPLRAVEPIARDFAGKSTHFDGALTISIWFSLAVSVAWALTGTQSQLRKKKIKRQRDRLTELEQEAEELRGKLAEYESGKARGRRQPKKQRVTAGEE